MLNQHYQFVAYGKRYIVPPVCEQNAFQCVYAYYVGVFVGRSFYCIVQFQQVLLVAEQGSENRIFVFAFSWHRSNIEINMAI